MHESSTNLFVWATGRLGDGPRNGSQFRKHAHEVESNRPESKTQPSFSDNNLATAEEIIRQHHKLTEWKPPSESAVNALLVNVVRQGDWADATMGLVRFDLPAAHLQQAYDAIPEAGFHNLLVGFGARISPDSFMKRLDVLKILKF